MYDESTKKLNPLHPHMSMALQFLPLLAIPLSQLYHALISKSLISVKQFCDDNDVFFEFHSHFFCVKDSCTQKTLLRGYTRDKLYVLPIGPSLPQAYSST